MTEGAAGAPQAKPDDTTPRRAWAVRSAGPVAPTVPADVFERANMVTVLDSNVMFDPMRRYALLSLERADAFATRWSLSLIGEWAEVIAREGRTTPERAERQRAKLLADFPDALVSPSQTQEALGDSLVNDPGDAHVAACALAAAPCTLLTFNGRDFKRQELQQHGVIVRKPGPWLAERYVALSAEEQDEWCRALEGHRQCLNDPAMTTTEYLDALGLRDRGLGPLVSLLHGRFLGLPRPAAVPEGG